MDGSPPADPTSDLEAIPVPALLWHGGVAAGWNRALAALAAPEDVARTLAAEAPGDSTAGASRSLLRLAGTAGDVLLEASVGPERDGARLVLLRDVSPERALRERLERRIDFERLLLSASAGLMRGGPDRLDRAIVDLLGAVGGFFGVDRAYVFLIDDVAGTQSNTHEWVAPGISREAENLQDLPLTTFPWLLQRLRADEVFRVETLADLPAAASAERAEFEREGIQSILIVPLWVGGDLHGFVGFDAVRRCVAWDEPYVIGLRLMAQMLAASLDARALARSLRLQAMHDALTGLPNRLFLHDRFETCVRRLPSATRSRALVALIDVDDFKRVNDRFGHAGGDALLRQLGQRLVEAAGEDAVVARVGGDEFVVVSPQGAPSIAAFAERLLEAAGRPFEVAGRPHSTGLSIGVTRGGSDSEDLDTVLERADRAMYAAKSRGKNGWASQDGDGVHAVDAH